jgi:hypothetical protein
VPGATATCKISRDFALFRVAYGLPELSANDAADGAEDAAAPTEGDHVKTAKIWALGMALMAATLGACSGERGARPASTSPGASDAAAPTVAATPAPTPQPVAAAPTATPAATPAPVKAASAPAKVEKAPSGKLTIKRLVVAEGVKGREPVGAATSFKGGAGKIYAFVEIENPSRHEDEIVIAFEPPGGGPSRGNVTLEVGASPRWRTWAFTRTARDSGEWTAVVKNKRGEVLAKTAFEVKS